MLYLGIKQFQDPYYQGVAAQVAFFFMLSIVPTMILLSQLLSLLNIPLENLEIYLSNDYAPQIMETIGKVFTFEPQTSTNIVLIFTAIWAVSRLQFTLMRVANYTMSGGRDAGTYLKDRIRSIVTVLLSLVSMVRVPTFPYSNMMLRDE